MHLCLVGFMLLATSLLASRPAEAHEATSVSQDAVHDSQAQLDARMKWWNEARFGMFIHWGLYSVPGGSWQGREIGGYAEWIQARADIAKADYVPLAAQFNPTKFDADAWVLAAKRAGMKYLVITTKHHDGFCLWPSQYTAWDVDDATEYQHDILAKLSEACRRHGLRFGTYYSIIDWHHPTQAPNSQAQGHWAKWGQIGMKPGRKAEYIAYMKNQIKELIERYDSDIMWFDGDWVHWWSEADGVDLYNYIRGLKPEIVINNRVSKRKTFKRDFGTPENFTPGAALDYYWEACWTMNHSWGYKAHDHTWKSDTTLIQKLIDINAKGGNLLLNIGPKPDGAIPQKSLDGLAALGDWTKANAQSIYGTRFSQLAQPSWGRITARGDKQLFLHVFELPADGQIRLASFQAAKVDARLLANGKPLEVYEDGQGIRIALAQADLQPHATVIALDLPHGYRVDPHLGEITLLANDLLLKPVDASIHGDGPLRVESEGQNLGHWIRPEQYARWNFELILPGKYHILAACAQAAGEKPTRLQVQSARGNPTADVPPTGNWGTYKIVHLGTLEFPELGRETLSLHLAKIDGQPSGPVNIKGVVLRPVE